MLLYEALEQFDSTLIVALDGFLISTVLYFLFFIFIVGCFLFILPYSFLFFNLTLVQSLLYFLTSFFVQLYRQQIVKWRYGFFVLLYTLFVFILISNFMGLFVYGFTITSHISLTFTLSSIFFFGTLCVGFSTHGLHFFEMVKPSGAPKVLIPFLIVIESISYLSRIFSLAIRLFANMMSGHTLLFILTNFLYFLLSVCSNFFFIIFVLVIFIVILSILLLEFSIAILQSYVFTVLTTIYLNDAIEGPTH